VQPILSAYAKVPAKETSTLGIGGWLGLIGAALAFNLVGYVVGRLSATLTANGAIFGWRSFSDLSWAYAFAGGAAGLIFDKVATFIDESELLHLVSLVMWPGFLIGFRLLNGLPPETQPTVWLGLIGVAGFLLPVLGKNI
jgi:hypothetical protein